MKKILLISNMYPNSNNPSYGIFVNNSYLILQRMGFEVDKIVLTKTSSKIIKLFKYIFYYFKIAFKITISKYDFIYVHYASHNAPILNLMSIFFKNLKIIVNVHGSDIVPEVKSRENLQSQVNKLLKNAYKIITPSKYFKNYIIEKYNLIADNIFVSPSGGLDPKTFGPVNVSKQKEQKFGIETKVIGYVGRIDFLKGWDILLKGFHEFLKDETIDNYKLIIVGNGNEIDDFWKLVNDLNIKNEIIYYPLISQKELNLIYNYMDVFVFPTMRDGESLGLVGLEAMLTGVPVIGSNFAGLTDYLKDGYNGYYFEKGNYYDLTNKLRVFFNNDFKQIENLSSNAINTAKSYTIEKVERDFKRIFEIEIN